MRRAILVGFLSLPALMASGAKAILVYNEDDTNFIQKVPWEEFVAYFDSVCRGAVTHFFMCPNAMRSNIPSKYLEPIWTACDEPGVRPMWAPAAKWLHDNGIDPYAIWTKRAREKGVSPWLTMRMNDIHGVDESGFPSLCTLWKEHPEYRCDPKYAGGRYPLYAFDYSHKAVRDRALGYIGELLERYDVDGIECDWLRFPWHFPEGEGVRRLKVLTDFMAEVRRVADAASARRGHRVLVGARVASNLDDALALGTDAVAWCRARTVDWLVVGNFFLSVDFDLDYARWAKAVHAVNPSVTVIPAADSGVQKDGWNTPRRSLTLPEYTGWCETQYAQGAPGVYLFNFFHHSARIGGDTRIWESALTGGFSPAGVAAADELAYPISFRDCLPSSSPGVQTGPLDRGRVVTIRIGCPPAGGSCAVRLVTEPALDEAARRRVTLNGVVPEGVTGGELRYPVSALKAGENRLSVPPSPGRLADCELFVRR